ncbi:hypothetical protein [Bacillus alkalicellulosilyticus]|uniref:hypothetical protein n=1 Tax=Alkalihalobacterium alkalicellulosilyticum TaxID=1912214 RepID=UPI0009981747|nr:hypothetical protein [Bacillus alkalicellulosilyticus]
MSSVLAKWMTLIIVVNIMFAPILAYVESLHREAVETVLHEGAKRAAIVGYFSEEIIEDMRQQLVEHYNFDENTIQFEGTQTLTYRHDYIQGALEVPRGIIFIIDIFNQGPDTIRKDIQIMSEY